MRRSEIFYIHSLGQSSGGKYPYFCKYLNISHIPAINNTLWDKSKEVFEPKTSGPIYKISYDLS